MDYRKIFLKEATPTSIGGQAIMEGVMMRGPDRNAIAVRVPDGRIFLKTEKRSPDGKWKKIPLIRGVVAFFVSMIEGMRTLMQSADILEQFVEEDEKEEPGRFETMITKRFGDRAFWNFLMAMSVIISLVISIAVFVMFPTVAVNWLKKWSTNAIVLNLIEGVFRIFIFFLYIVLIKRMEDIKTLFRYHGAEHKTIHCYESGLELTPENAREFYTLHPRCGTSFLMFVFIISLLLFSFLGWPNLAVRIASRVLLLPVIAGISYELLKWAGRSNNVLVRILSWPGLMMQKLTTEEPTDEQLEVAIVSLKAVLADKSMPEVEGFCDTDVNIIEPKTYDDIIDENSEYIPKHKERTLVPVPAKEDREPIPEMIFDDGGEDFVPADLLEDKMAPDKMENPAVTDKSDNPQSSDDLDPASEDGLSIIFADEGAGGESRRKEGDTIIPWPELKPKRYSDGDETVMNTIRRANEKLSEIPNGKNEALDLFSYAMGFSRSEIVTRGKELLLEKDIQDYEDLVNKRLSGVPLQYIIKVQEFMGLPFKVSRDVLIPRLDTEVLAEQVIGLMRGKGRKDPAILDLCTGSGALGITLAHEFPSSEVTLADVSEKAIEIARENAEINGVSDRCSFYTGNLFAAVPENSKFDLIVCNPPYIESDLIETLATEVKDHEPRLALDGGKDGLDFYRRIAMESADYLHSGGILALEIGDKQAAAVSLLLEVTKNFRQSVVIKDLNGLDRVVLIERV